MSYAGGGFSLDQLMELAGLSVSQAGVYNICLVVVCGVWGGGVLG